MTGVTPPLGTLTLGCAGFALPPTRYFKELGFVELQETLLGAPGASTARRWRREAPPDATFAVVAPRILEQEGFRLGPVTLASLEALEPTLDALGTRTLVVTSPAGAFADTRPNVAAVDALLAALAPRYAPLVWEAPASFKPRTAERLARAAGAVLARDPLVHGLVDGDVAYYRLRGQAGPKSRYEDPAMQRLVELARGASHRASHWVFANVDMLADVRRFKKGLEA